MDLKNNATEKGGDCTPLICSFTAEINMFTGFMSPQLI